MVTLTLTALDQKTSTLIYFRSHIQKLMVAVTGDDYAIVAARYQTIL